MSESVHAVLARKKQNLSNADEFISTKVEEDSINTNQQFTVNPIIDGTHSECDDDDDIDIINTTSDHQSTIASTSSHRMPFLNSGSLALMNIHNPTVPVAHLPPRPSTPRSTTIISGQNRPSPGLFDQQYERLRNLKPNVISIQTDDSIRLSSSTYLPYDSDLEIKAMQSSNSSSATNPLQFVNNNHPVNFHHSLPQRNTSSNQNSPRASNNDNVQDEWQTENGHEQARDRLRRALRYYFMSPIDKWHIKGRFPWKLFFQLIKIIIVTIQVILFGSNVTLHKSNNISQAITLHSLLLQSWDTAQDFKLVPPSVGPYAVYTKDAVWSHIDFSIKNYANIQNTSVGVFGYQINREKFLFNHSSEDLSPIDVCFTRFTNGTMNPSYGEYFLDSTEVIDCITIKNLFPPGDERWKDFSIVNYLVQHNQSNQIDNFDSLNLIVVKLPLRTILLDNLIDSNSPECFDIDTSINFNNHAHSGQIRITMHTIYRQFNCLGNLQNHSKSERLYNFHLIVNFIVLVLSIFSFLLCIRSFCRSQRLRKRTVRFFIVAYHRRMETKSAMHFIDGWLLMILLNDLLLISGTCLNILHLFETFSSKSFSLRFIEWENLCSALLGLGNLLAWFGVLRYLAFFSKYNVLIVTIKHSLPRVMRFLLCVLVLYCGFCFSGWIILGSFHWKFQTLARTSECLFALMNGDDVFATFAYLQESSLFVWWFSRLYLYSYVLLFIYIVLSLFIALLMDSYETIKEYYHSKPETRKGVLLFSNDSLARFINSMDLNEIDDNFESYRISLMRDEQEEFEVEQSIRTNGTVSSGNSPGCYCDACHFLSCFFAPFRWTANCARHAFFKLRRQRTNQNSSSEENEHLRIN